MKRFIAVLCLVMAIGTLIMVVSHAAEEVPTEDVVVDNEVDNAVDNVVTETAPTTQAPVQTEPEMTLMENFVEWVKANLAYLSVLATSLVIAIYDKISRGRISKTIGTVNNNSIAMANNSSEIMNAALEKVASLAEKVRGFDASMSEFMAEMRRTVEEKKSLEETMAEVVTFMKATKAAALEASNEVAELLVLANIPNSKKEELYARHIEAIRGLEAPEEVSGNERKEA